MKETTGSGIHPFVFNAMNSSVKLLNAAMRMRPDMGAGSAPCVASMLARAWEAMAVPME